MLICGDQKVMRDNPKVVWAEFSILSYAAFNECNCMAKTSTLPSGAEMG
jgi:hypothetical protein